MSDIPPPGSGGMGETLVVNIDYGDGSEPEMLFVKGGFSHFYPYEDNQKYTVTVEVVEAPGVDITVEVEGLSIVLDYSGYGVQNGCEVFFGDGTGPHYPGPGGTQEELPMHYTYETAGTYTISVDPLGPSFPASTYDVTVGDPEVGAHFDPDDYTVQEVEDYVSDHPDERDAILAAERSGKNRVTLIAWLENHTTES